MPPLFCHEDTPLDESACAAVLPAVIGILCTFGDLALLLLLDLLLPMFYSFLVPLPPPPLLYATDLNDDVL